MNKVRKRKQLKKDKKNELFLKAYVLDEAGSTYVVVLLLILLIIRRMYLKPAKY